MENSKVGAPVLFKKWIPAEYVPSSNPMKKIDGTGCFTEMVNRGRFLGWGVEFHEFDNGIGNQTVALIEITKGIDRGTVVTAIPQNMKFGWRKVIAKTK